MSLEEFLDALRNDRPEHWDEMPDIDLYMDQLLEYMTRQQIDPANERQLTSSMINNYIKAGLITRAKGKRYTRAHLAELTAVLAFKQVLQVNQMQKLADAIRAKYDTRHAYEAFWRELDKALNATADTMEENRDKDLTGQALELAVKAYANSIACEAIVKKILEKQ